MTCSTSWSMRAPDVLLVQPGLPEVGREGRQRDETGSPLYELNKKVYSLLRYMGSLTASFRRKEKKWLHYTGNTLS